MLTQFITNLVKKKKEHIILILEYIQNTWDKICLIGGKGDLICLSIQFNNTVNLV